MKTYTDQNVEAEKYMLWVSNSKGKKGGFWIDLREIPYFKQLQAKVDLMENIFNSLNLLGKEVIKSLGITPSEYISHNFSKLVKQSKLVVPGKNDIGIEMAGEYIKAAMRIKYVTDEVPDDVANGCFKFENGRSVLDQKKKEELEGM